MVISHMTLSMNMTGKMYKTDQGAKLFFSMTINSIAKLLKHQKYLRLGLLMPLKFSGFS